MITQDIRVERMHDDFIKYHLNANLQYPWPFNAVVHSFTAPDTGDAHDHPWGFTSHILYGSYVEEVFTINEEDGTWSREVITRRAGTVHHVTAKHIHRIIALPEGECYTIILPGEPEQKSGFWKFEGDNILYRPWDSPNFGRYQ